MKYKYSKYNIYRNIDGDLIIFNSLRGNFSKIKGLDIDIIEKVIKNEIIPDISSYLFNILIDNNYLINASSDEDRLLKQLVNDVTKSEKVNLIIFPTENCNFRCNYCYENFKVGLMSSQIVDDILKMLDKKKFRYLAVSWFGGEPLININKFEEISKKLITFCRERKVIYTSNITTNGYNLDFETFKKIRKLKVSNFQVTIDGLATTHDKNRHDINGRGTWEKIIKNLLTIKNETKSSTFSITIRTNITKEIYDLRHQYIEFLVHNFGSDKRFKFIFCPVENWGGDTAFESQNYIGEREYKEFFIDTLEQGLKNGLVLDTLKPGGLLCYAYKQNSITIRPDGTIGKCTLHLYKEINKISKAGLFEFDDQEEFWNFDNKAMLIKCLNCPKYPICLKIECNLGLENEKQCEFTIKNLESLFKYISVKEYGCKIYNEN